MQTTLTIDDDVLSAAESLAAEQKRSVGEVISELSRKGLRPNVPPFIVKDGIPMLLVEDFTPTTTEFVNRLRDELP